MEELHRATLKEDYLISTAGLSRTLILGIEDKDRVDVRLVVFRTGENLSKELSESNSSSSAGISTLSAGLSSLSSFFRLTSLCFGRCLSDRRSSKLATEDRLDLNERLGRGFSSLAAKQKADYVNQPNQAFLETPMNNSFENAR